MDAADISGIAAELSRLDVDGIAGGDLGSTAIAVEWLRNAVEAASAAVLAALQSRGPWAADGATSAAAWVAARTGSAGGDLRRRQRVGGGVAAVAGRGGGVPVGAPVARPSVPPRRLRGA